MSISAVSLPTLTTLVITTPMPGQGERLGMLISTYLYLNIGNRGFKKNGSVHVNSTIASYQCNIIGVGSSDGG